MAEAPAKRTLKQMPSTPGEPLPCPSLPFPSKPYPGEKETDKGTTFLNGNTFRSAVRAEDARANRAEETA